MVVLFSCQSLYLHIPAEERVRSPLHRFWGLTSLLISVYIIFKHMALNLSDEILTIISGIVFLLWPICIPPNGASVEKAARSEGKPVFGGTYRRPLDSAPKPSIRPYLRIPMPIRSPTNSRWISSIRQRPQCHSRRCQSWKISTDGLSYTFYLREGAKFHTGREVTADDFVYSFTRIIDPKNNPGGPFNGKSPGVHQFQDRKADNVSGFRSLDKYIFE